MQLRDPVSSASHFLTAAWAIYATLLLLRLTPGSFTRRVSVAVFGLSMIVLYLASGLFHAIQFQSPQQRSIFQKLDQSAISVLIAGTNTPCLAIILGGAWGRWFLRIIWAFSAAIIACLWLLPKPPHALVVSLFLGMGWFGVLPVFHYYRKIGWRAMNWVWVGAGLYTMGAVCELSEWPVIILEPVRISYHEVFHFFDTAASLAFFFFILRHVIFFETREPALQREDTSRGTLDTDTVLD